MTHNDDSVRSVEGLAFRHVLRSRTWRDTSREGLEIMSALQDKYGRCHGSLATFTTNGGWKVGQLEVRADRCWQDIGEAAIHMAATGGQA
jgi:hypothetical protein